MGRAKSYRVAPINYDTESTRIARIKAKELAAVYLCVYVLLIFTVAGVFSLDRFFVKRSPSEAKG